MYVLDLGAVAHNKQNQLRRLTGERIVVVAVVVVIDFVVICFPVVRPTFPHADAILGTSEMERTTHTYTKNTHTLKSNCTSFVFSSDQPTTNPADRIFRLTCTNEPNVRIRSSACVDTPTTTTSSACRTIVVTTTVQQLRAL